MRRDTEAETARYLRARARFGPLEIAFWLVAFSTIWLLPTRHLILTETVIWGLFALSLDLILGYAGIISLGHAAFFGVGAYAAGLLAKQEIINEPSLALLASALAAATLGFADQLFGAARIRPHPPDGNARRFAGVPRTRQPIRRGHRRRRRAAGRHHRAGIRSLPVRYVRPYRLCLLPGRAVHPVHAGAAHRQFAVRPVARGDQGQSAAQRGGRHRRELAAGRGLYAVGRHMPASPAGCWRRPRPSRRCRCCRSNARPTCS